MESLFSTFKMQTWRKQKAVTNNSSVTSVRKYAVIHLVALLVTHWAAKTLQQSTSISPQKQLSGSNFLKNHGTQKWTGQGNRSSSRGTV